MENKTESNMENETESEIFLDKINVNKELVKQARSKISPVLLEMKDAVKSYC